MVCKLFLRYPIISSPCNMAGPQRIVSSAPPVFQSTLSYVRRGTEGGNEKYCRFSQFISRFRTRQRMWRTSRAQEAVGQGGCLLDACHIICRMLSRRMQQIPFVEPTDLSLFSLSYLPLLPPRDADLTVPRRLPATRVWSIVLLLNTSCFPFWDLVLSSPIGSSARSLFACASSGQGSSQRVNWENIAAGKSRRRPSYSYRYCTFQIGCVLGWIFTPKALCQVLVCGFNYFLFVLCLCLCCSILVIIYTKFV